MMDKKIQKLFDKVDALKAMYTNHFGQTLPDKIIGWWDPTNISNYPDELSNGVDQMEKDILNAIKSNTPIGEIPADKWKKLIF